ncbi:MAG: permease-like cell division protein FtsX [Bacilli bacterium]|nr:permease-like cell division protein FtsX [Bacilli bacterium]
MKAFRILSRNIRDSFKSVFRNFSLSLASISCITITLIVVAVAIILSINVTNFTKIVERDVTIVAFLDVDITEEEKDDVYDQIIALDNIEMSNVEFIDKMEISKDMMASSDVFNSIMGEWTREESPIQDTYQIKVTDINLINKTAEEIKDIENVEIVKYGEGMVEQLVSVFDAVRKGTYVVVIALILVTAFLIANTIKITIMSRKREIEIMRLVGASNINIKIPFIFEGLILGMLGSVIPIVITLYGYTAIYDHFGGQLFTNFIQLVEPTPFIYYTSLALLLIGMIVGMIGSSRAVKKYLKI